MGGKVAGSRIKGMHPGCEKLLPSLVQYRGGRETSVD